MNYRFLTNADLPQIYATFTSAFADYYVDINLSEAQFATHLADNGVRYELSVAAMAGQDMVGILLNGIDTWHDGALTAYDAGTGVVPEFRGQGIAGGLVEYATSGLKAHDVTQCLLEVIQNNDAALRAYQKLGFTETRGLHCIFRDASFENLPIHPTPNIVIRELDTPDWAKFQTFWDWYPAWQNSIGSVMRAKSRNTTLAAFDGEHCVGYGVVFPEGGRISQLAVDKDNRSRGIGSMLLQAMTQRVASDQNLSLINIDGSAAETLSFFAGHGFQETVKQYEMVLRL